MNFVGILFLNWWDVSYGGVELDESSINRDIVVVIVLVEYVIVVF